MTSLLEKGCTLLIHHAIACNPDYYSPRFYAAIDQASPLGNSYQLANKESLLTKGHGLIDTLGSGSRLMSDRLAHVW